MLGILAMGIFVSDTMGRTAFVLLQIRDQISYLIVSDIHFILCAILSLLKNLLVPQCIRNP
jgi:hypothetical protein